jgi:HlyD family secretion protein
VVVVAAVAAVAPGAYAAREATKPPPLPRFTEKAVQRRDVVQEVQSTGKVKPLTEVQVGAQVTGRVVKVLVDFNSTVKKGDLLAEIDPQLFGAQVSQVQAQLEAAKANQLRAEASLATASTTFDRLEALRREGVATPAEVDQAKGSRAVASAEVAASKATIAQLRAQLTSARTTLQYTQIYSPIDGVVINREIDPGQTVAASLSAPVLFVIAQDLSKMQVMADIDEADVGKLTETMPATVIVDAFPGDTFRGKVTQIRYSPTEVQGVVTYSAVIDVDNPELKLRPGMTATVSISTKSATGVAAVPNASLRFRPIDTAAPDEDGAPSDDAGPTAPLKFGEGRVYQTAGGQPGAERAAEKVVRIGITDGMWTEVQSGLAPGDSVIVEQRDAKKKAKFLGIF